MLASVLLETQGLTGTGTPPKLDGAGLWLWRKEGMLTNCPEPELSLQTWTGHLIFDSSV